VTRLAHQLVMGLRAGDRPDGVGGEGGGQAGAQRGVRDPGEQGVEGLAAHLAEPLPAGGDVGVGGGSVAVGLPAARRTPGEQPVLAGEVREQAAGIGAVVEAEGGGDDLGRLPPRRRGLVVAVTAVCNTGSSRFRLSPQSL
jgi:hypothetical protein